MSADDNYQAGNPLPTVLVRERARALHNRALDMKCDEREIPDPITPAASYLGTERKELTLRDVVSAKSNQTRWIAVGRFVGKARHDGQNAVEEVSPDPTGVAMVIVETEGRLLGILGPDDPGEPAIWWAWPLNELTVEIEGQQGMLRKRPRQISIGAFGSRVDLVEVSSVRNDKSSFTTGREAGFLKALSVTTRA